MVKRVLQVAFFALVSNALFGQIVINEFLASNSTTNTDPDFGAYSDWIELYNAGATSEDLAGYFLSDDELEPKMWEIPAGTTLGAGKYLLIWADKESGTNHANFKLGASGESIFLSSPNGSIVDSYTFGEQQEDISMGRSPNGTGEFSYFTTPTPSSANNSSATIGVAPEPTFSKPSGFYSSATTVSLTTTLAGAEIYYTLDGSEPTESSNLYSGSITLSENTALRARVIHPKYQIGRVSTQTYFIGERDIDLPVVSLAVDPFDYFDETYGMYMEGPNAEPVEPYFGANYWEDREEPVSFEYFDETGTRQVQVNAGVKIFGGWSRAVNDQRSVSINCREDLYGDDRIRYKLFKDKDISSFKSIVLRNSGNDQSYSMMRDAAMQAMVKTEMDIDYQAYQPAAVFVNGEYWGIQNIREKLNEHYVEGNTGYDNDDIEFLTGFMEVSNRDSLHYRAMFDFATNNDLSIEKNYRYMETQMDMDEYIDYLICEIFFANADWPDNNIKYWRKSGFGGKWRWILFDLDFGLGIWYSTSSADAVKQAFEGTLMSTRSWIMEDWGPLLNENLIVNQEFRDKLVQRFAFHLGTTFDSDRTTQIIADIASAIKNEIPYHKDKWNQHDGWKDEVENMKSWAERRPAYVESHLESFFSLTGKATLYLTANTGIDKYIVSGMDVASSTFSSQFFTNVPIFLQAIPKAGHVFSHWENSSGTVISTDAKLELTITKSTEIQAVFDAQPELSNIFINEVLPDNKQIATDENGQYEDIIELYNGNNTAVDVGGLFLSDSPTEPKKWTIPVGMPEVTTIPAGGFLIIYADKDPLHGPLHADFKLSATADSVILSQQLANGSLATLDQITFEGVLEDVSYGHYPDGSGNFDAFITPSPGAANIENEDLPISGIFINEFQASNRNTATDETGGFADWIELYNSNATPVDVGGLFLTDDLDDPFKSRISSTEPLKTTIPAKGYLLLWADGNTDQGAKHVDFSISATSGYIALNQKLATGSKAIDEVLYSQQVPDISYGLYPNGGDTYSFMLKPTPGGANRNVAYTPTTGLFINEVLALNENGAKDEQGEHAPWIEIHYAGNSIINIAGLYLTDDQTNPYKYTITRKAIDKTTLSNGDKLCLWLDGEKEEGDLHANFTIDPLGGTLYLYEFDGTTSALVESFAYDPATTDRSYGRYPDGDNHTEVMPATHNAKNVSNTTIAHLINLKVGSYDLTPEFSPETIKYSVLLPPGTSAVPPIVPTPFSQGQTVKTKQATSVNGKGSVTVIAENGKDSLVYEVSLSVVLSSDSKLADLSVSKGELSHEFSASITSYVLSLEGDNIPPVISAEANYSGATVDIEQASSVPGVGIVTVTAEDGSQTIYTIEMSTGPAIVEGFVENFDDNFNNGWEDASEEYTFTEENGEMTVNMIRTLSSNTWESCKFKFPLKIVNMTNYPYVSLKMKTADPLEVRLDLRDIDGKNTNSAEIKVAVEESEYTEFYFDFSGKFFQRYPEDEQGPVDYKQITDLIFFFEPGVGGNFTSQVIFEDVKIGKAAYRPEYDSRLANITVDGYTLFPPFDPSETNYTIVVDDTVTKTPNVSALAAHENATVAYYPTSEIPGKTRIKVTAENDDDYQYYDVNFEYAPEIGCAGGQILTETTGTITDGSGDENYIEYADCFWLIQPRLADTIFLSFVSLETQEEIDHVQIYDGANTDAPLLADASGIDISGLQDIIATSGSALVHFITDEHTEKAGWEIDYRTVTKPSSDASLAGITITQGELTQDFSTIETNFIVNASSAEVVPSIIPKLNDIGATYSIENATEIPGTSTLTVIAEDGTTQKYTFAIIAESDLLQPLDSIVSIQYEKLPNIVLQNKLQANVPVTWSVAGNVNIGVTIQNGVATFTPDPTWYGTETISISATVATITDTEKLLIRVKQAEIPLEAIGDIPTEATLDYPETLIFEPTLTPPTTTDTELFWHSSDNTIVSVSDAGVAKAEGNGTATITVYNADSTIVAQCVVDTRKCLDPITVSISDTAIALTTIETFQLVASAEPECLRNKMIKWTSSNIDIVSVSASGIAIPIAPGDAYIYAKSEADNSVSAKCSVHVTEPCSTDSVKIEADKTDILLTEGIAIPFSITISPENACNQELSFEIENEKIATVKDGEIVAIAEGNTSIKITNGDETTTPATIAVEVKAKERPVDSVHVSAHELALVVGTTQLLTATIFPEKATIQNMSWYSSNGKATVKDGLVEAKDTGRVVITVETLDGSHTDSCVITILPLLAEKLTVNPKNQRIYPGDNIVLLPQIEPIKATIQDITWISRNTDIATVNGTGLVKAVSKGATYIVGTINDGQGITDSTLVTVLEMNVDSVVLSVASLAIDAGTSAQIKATVYPISDQQKDPAYYTKDNAIASVSKDGQIVAKEVGSTIVYATAGDRVDSCLLTVKPVLADEIIVTKSIGIIVGDSTVITASILPKSTTDKTIEWKSDSPEIVSVTSLGKIKALKAGVAIIYASTSNGKEAKCEVKASNKAVAIDSVVVPENMYVAIGQTIQINFKIWPENATSTTMACNVADTTVAIIENGIVFGKAEGTTAVEISVGTITKTINITVSTVAVRSISIENPTISLRAGTAAFGTYKINPSNAAETGATWSSSNSHILSVDDNQYVGKFPGEAYLIVTSKDGGFKDSVLITVTEVPMEELTIIASAKTLLVNTSLQLMSSFFPNSTTIQTINWHSSNSDAISVNSTGLVSAHTEGEAWIYAENHTGTVKDSILLSAEAFKEYLDSIQVHITDTSISLGKTARLTVVPFPTNSINAEFTYSSSSPGIASVSQIGIVTGITTGSAEITVQSKDGSVSQRILVNVHSKLTEHLIIPKQLLLVQGDYSTDLFDNITIIPKDAAMQVEDIIWVVEPAGMVSIKNGQVIALKIGTAKIIAMSGDGQDTTQTEVIISKNEKPSIKRVPELFAYPKTLFDPIYLSEIVTDDHTLSKDIKWIVGDTKDITYSIDEENGILQFATKDSMYFGTEKVTLIAVDEQGQSSYTTLHLTVTTLLPTSADTGDRTSPTFAPNPAKREIVVSNALHEELTVQIIGINGAVLKSASTSLGHTRITVSDLPVATYTILFISKDKTWSKLLIVE